MFVIIRVAWPQIWILLTHCGGLLSRQILGAIATLVVAREINPVVPIALVFITCRGTFPGFQHDSLLSRVSLRGRLSDFWRLFTGCGLFTRRLWSFCACVGRYPPPCQRGQGGARAVNLLLLGYWFPGNVYYLVHEFHARCCGSAFFVRLSFPLLPIRLEFLKLVFQVWVISFDFAQIQCWFVLGTVMFFLPVFDRVFALIWILGLGVGLFRQLLVPTSTSLYFRVFLRSTPSARNCARFP